MDDASLLLLRDFVNTRDIEAGTDGIASAADLVRWLAERGLIAASARAGAADVKRAGALREALRDHLAANGGGELPPEAAGVLDRQAARSRVVLGFDATAAPFHVGAAGVDGALGRLLVLAARAMVDGSWSRLKACRAGGCRWAFLDTSRNASRHWCAMRVCGNREKVRAFRARRSSVGEARTETPG